MFGAGIYFAWNASKSDRYVFNKIDICDEHGTRNCEDCTRQVLCCEVTLGYIFKIINT